MTTVLAKMRVTASWPGALARLALFVGCMACRPPPPKPVETFPAGPDGLGVRFSVVVIDVGESDSTLILGPGHPEERIAMLVDAGHDEAVRSVLEELQVQDLHYAVLSRYDPDHMRGFVEEPGLLWSSAMVVEEAKEKPAADRAIELAEELARELARQKEGAEQAEAAEDAEATEHAEATGQDDAEKSDQAKDDDPQEEPEPPVPQKPRAHRAAENDARELPRSLLCNTTELTPKRAIVDPGSPPTSDEPGEAWWACASQLGRRIDHVTVRGGRHIGEQIELGEGLTARIVAGGGHVWGYDHPIATGAEADGHGIVLLISNGQGFELLLMPDQGGTGGRPAGATLIQEAIADQLMREGIDIEVIKVANHGAERAASRRLLARVKPEVAIISTGDDQPEDAHHPRCRTLHALTSGGVGVVLQTEAGSPDCNPRDEERRFVTDGSIRIDVTGSDYTISTVGRRSLVTGKKTRHIAFACSVRRGCYWFKQWED